ncbi:hypothetical protein [Natronoarchaeum rubrum]|uniref:hypothetical protein n=1 Tax=Natronoarchaeum rubrum TaxID=755311 RepID=UPI0021119A24|nr:hypothetical protein [Natronoarchaeum rubrum]
MSTTTHPDGDVQIYECAYCGGDRRASASVAGSFCSIECHRAHKRAKRAGEIFELVEHDHRFCRTCFAQLKEVSKPARTLVIPPSLHDEDWGNASDVLVGYQYRTEHAETGEISMDVDAEGDRAIVEDGVAMGTICECGATDHRDDEPAIRESMPAGRLVLQLAAAAETLRQEGKHDVDYDAEHLGVAMDDGADVVDALEEAVILDD